MQLEPLKALSHTCWWLISFCVCVFLCVCVRVHACMSECVSDLCLFSLCFCFPVHLSHCILKLTEAAPAALSAATCATRLWTCQHRKPHSHDTHAHSFLPDLTQCAHIPVLPHLSQQLWAFVRVCLCDFTNTWRAKQSNLRHRHWFMWRLELSASVRPIPLCISILEMALKLHMEASVLQIVYCMYTKWGQGEDFVLSSCSGYK